MSQDLSNEVKIQIENFIDHICSCGDISTQMIKKTQSMISEYMYTNLSTSVSKGGSTRHHTSNNSIDIKEVALYNHIKTCLENNLNKIYQYAQYMPDNDVLTLYVEHWSNYRIMCDTLHVTCLSLNLQWIRHHLHTEMHNIDRPSLLSQQLWEKILFKPLFPRITESCLNLIDMHRNTHSFLDPKLIKNILCLYVDKSFIEMIKIDAHNKTLPDIYADRFEKKFLRQAHEFYCHQKTRLETNQMIEYLISISKYFYDELTFAISYLPKEKSTLKKLYDQLEDIFLPASIFDCICNELELLVQNENNDQKLISLCKPISQILTMKNEFVKMIENHFYKQVMNALGNVKGLTIKNSEVYIETIINVQKKLLRIVQGDLNNKIGLRAVFDKVCREVLHEKAVIKIDGCRIELSKLLAQYCDVLLRKGPKADLTEKFDEILIVFDCIEDKDTFKTWYPKHLMNRLVDRSSISHDHEILMLSKLQEIYNEDFTFKLELEQIRRDMIISQKLTNDYQTDEKRDFTIIIFSPNIWPYSASENILLPIELKSTLDSFIDFYNHDHNARKLVWLHQYSKGELEVCFTSQNYILEVSIYQMVVLLLFNKVLTLTIQQIQVQTQIKIDILFQVIFSLLKSKILICDNTNELGNSNDVERKINYSIRLGTHFESKTTRINLNVLLQIIQQKADGDQKYVIQAAIIRIMKDRKTLLYQLLIDQVIEQINRHFQTTNTLIKDCIDLLIEKEYLKRNSNQNDILHYLP